MAEIISAIYEEGRLRPLSPLDLNEHQTVRIQILPETTDSEIENAIQEMITSGILTPPPGHSDIAPLSEQERFEVADLWAQAEGKPLSEIIIDDRK